jgi:hypothetical protein
MVGGSFLMGQWHANCELQTANCGLRTANCDGLNWQHLWRAVQSSWNVGEFSHSHYILFKCQVPDWQFIIYSAISTLVCMKYCTLLPVESVCSLVAARKTSTFQIDLDYVRVVGRAHSHTSELHLLG